MTDEGMKRWIQDMVVDPIVEGTLKSQGEKGHVIVRRACESARAELVAVLGHKGAAHMLRALAQRIEDEESGGD